MAFSWCFFGYPLPWIAVLVPVLAYFAFLNCGFLPSIFTASFSILSSILFTTSSRHKPASQQPSDQDHVDQDGSPGHDQVEEVVSEPELYPKQLSKEAEVRLGDAFSESESNIDRHSSTTDQDSEADWSCGNLGQSPEDSSDDYSLSDEEGLIEIALPDGNYVKEEAKANLQQKVPDVPSEPILEKQGLIEFLAEINDINEEDNLIEIDISMGSIKCSRFEFEA
ncbi:hypothetical protein NMG60_11003323 [Bertholletia excelsa]